MGADTRRPFVWRLAAGVGLGVLLAAGCHHSPGVYTATPGGPSGPGPSQPVGTGSGATATQPGTGQPAPWGPDARITPGATLPVTKDDVCVPGYSGKVRNVPESIKKQAYANYHVTSRRPGDYEVDHLISLELGGSNSIKNLWPESYKTQPWNAHVKDQLENALHADVCSGRIDLKAAQQQIATDWITAYKKEFHTNGPVKSGKGRRHKGPLAADASQEAGDSAGAQAPVSAAAEASAPAAAQVWVNLGSGKYFLPGTKYYGKTKQGKYLSEADAKKQGYVAAQGQ